MLQLVYLETSYFFLIFIQYNEGSFTIVNDHRTTVLSLVILRRSSIRKDWLHIHCVANALKMYALNLSYESPIVNTI